VLSDKERKRGDQSGLEDEKAAIKSDVVLKGKEPVFPPKTREKKGPQPSLEKRITVKRRGMSASEKKQGDCTP